MTDSSPTLRALPSPPARLRMRTILNQTFGFIGLLQPDGTLIDINQAPLEAGGFARDDVIGKPFWETGWWNRSPAAQEALKRAIEAAARGDAVRDEAVYFTAEGAERVVDRSLTPVRDANGTICYVLAEGRDITERKALERALRASEARFRRVFRLAPEPLCITRLEDGVVLDVNDAFLEVHGLKRAEVLGRTSGELGWWVDANHRAEFIQRVRQRGSVRGLTRRVRLRSGELRTLRMSLERVEIDGEECLLASQVDVTERERLLVLEERQRISADLHDNTVQSLYAIVLRLAAAERLLRLGGAAGAAPISSIGAGLREAKRSLLETIQGTRGIIEDLAANDLGERGIRSGIEAVADTLEETAGIRTSVVVTAGADVPLDGTTTGALLLLAREAASNVARHSGATRAQFLLSGNASHVQLTVRDNGTGFEVPDDLMAGRPGDAEHTDRPGHHGLRTMAQRAAGLGGYLDVRSAPGGGTVVRATVPISRAAPSGGPKLAR